MARLPGISKTQRAARRRCPGCGSRAALVQFAGTVFVCPPCKVELQARWEREQKQKRRRV